MTPQQPIIEEMFCKRGIITQRVWVLLGLTLISTACALRWTPSFSVWQKLTENTGTSTTIGNEGSCPLSNYYNAQDVLSFYDKLFGHCVDTSGSESIIPSVLKPRDIYGNTQLINPMSYKAVDMEDLLHCSICTIKGVLDESLYSVQRGALGAARGVGGGKSFFMAKLHEQLRSSEYKHMLPILITFGDRWGTSDFYRYKCMFPANPEQAFALAVISRLASVCFNLPHQLVVDRIVEASDMWQRLFHWDLMQNRVALFLVYLAQRRGGIRDIVLLVDDADQSKAALTDVYRPKNTFDYTFGLHAALLRDDVLSEFGMRGAYVESGVMPTVAMSNAAGPRSYSMVLSEHLNSTTVTHSLFLTDLDPDGSMHAVTPYLSSEDTAYGNDKNGTDVAFEWLRQVAAYYAHSPRALEFAQDYLRCRVDRNTTPRSLVVTSLLVEGLFEYVEKQFKQINPVLYNNCTPSVDALYGMFLNKVVHSKPHVFEGLRCSLYTNSLLRFQGFLGVSEESHIGLRTTLPSLNAAVCGSPLVNTTDTIEFYLYNLCKIYREYVVAYPRASRERTLKDLSAGWLQLKLTLSARNGNQFIYVYDLLKTGCVGLNPRCDIPFTTVHNYLEYNVTLPTSGVVPMYTLTHAFNATTATASGVSTAVLDESNTIQLSEQVPCVVLKAAEGDCWGYGFAFLDEKNISRVIIMGTEVEESGDGSTPRCDAQYYLIQKVAGTYKVKGSGIGDAIATGNFIYVCHSTADGKSFEREGASIVTLRPENLKFYYNNMLGPFLSIKGEEVKPPPLVLGDLRHLNPYLRVW